MVPFPSVSTPSETFPPEVTVVFTEESSVARVSNAPLSGAIEEGPEIVAVVDACKVPIPLCRTSADAGPSVESVGVSVL
jgi:hypothetical protein